MKFAPARPILMIAGSLALLACAARADEDAVAYKFSDPAKPGTLRVHIAFGNIRVSGDAGAEIRVSSEVKSAKPAGTVRADGLRALTSAYGYTFSEKNNVASLTCTASARSGGKSDFAITVPRDTTVVITANWGGNVSCSDIGGNIEVKTMDGSVNLDNVTGGAAVEAMNGEIHASVRELRPDRPLCFTSMNGAITIRVPADSKANIRLRTQNGEILTDFDEKALATKTEVAASQDIREAAREVGKAAREAARAVRNMVETDNDLAQPSIPSIPPLPPMTGGKVVAGALNGGGTAIQAATMNGDVILRKADDGK